MIIASVAAVIQAIYGNVHVLEGVLVGVPAIGGVLFGTWMQQRVSARSHLAAVRGPGRRGRHPAGPVVIEAALVGILAGVVAGMLGVGGGILFVPALTIGLGLSQVEAEATSLLAVVPVALVGAWRQERYGNVAVKEAAVIGALSGLGVLAGVVLANALPTRALKLAFAGLLLLNAYQLSRRAIKSLKERKRVERRA